MGMPGEPIVGGGSSVLEDPTGRRARRLRLAGRVVFVVFLGWLVAIVLGGLGLMPVAGIPLTHALRPSQGPPVLTNLPEPRQPSTSDLRPALTAADFKARTARAAAQAKRAAGALHGKSATAPGRTKTTPAGAQARGHSTTAPGQTKTTPATRTSRGNSAIAPGKTRTTTTLPASKRKNTVAPGRTKSTTTATTTTSATTTTLPAGNGKSTVAPGQTTANATSAGQSNKP
jgi:hypothetical protein